MSPLRLLCLLLLPLAAPAPLALAGEDPELTVQRITSLPRIDGTPPEQPVWSPDSERIAFVWNDHGMPFRDVWVAGPEQEEPVRLTRRAPDPEDVAMPPEDTDLESLSARQRERQDRGIGEIAWTPDGESVVFVHGGRLYRVSADGEGSPERVMEDVHGISDLGHSPDGEWLSFLRDGDLWLREGDSDEPVRVTDLGEPSIGTVALGAYVRPDAYVSGYEWSPDGSAIALEAVDQQEVRRVPFPSYLHEEPLLHEARRPYPGDTDLVRQIGIHALGEEGVEWIDLEEPNRRLNLEMTWSPERAELLVMQGADVAETRWIHIVNADSGQVRTIHQDQRPRRIYPVFRAMWDDTGERVIFISDHEDWYRLYALDRDGQGEPERLTGEFDVAGERGPAWIRSHPESGAILFQAGIDDPAERHVYRIDDSQDDPRKITLLDGLNQPELSPDGRWLAVLNSADTRPTELYLQPAEPDGEDRAVRLTRSPLPEFEDFDWLEARYVEFESRIDDFKLRARIVEPPGLDPEKRYPVIIGNLYSDTVRSTWNPDRPTSLLQQQMAMDGDYISVQVDVRGSVGYGVAFREAFQGDWGRDDLEDIHSLVEYLVTLPQVDPDRIGLWGNSYGGLLTLTGLFRKPGVFAAGVAGAPAVDVHHFTGFDQHLTRRPDTHPEIFEEGSLLDLGEDLQDPLMIIHGMHDDIVPFKTTLMLAEKLILLGKDFELVPVHDSGHWWAANEAYANYTFGRMTDFLRRHVPPGPEPGDYE